tara:strand:+ start:2019 stop:2267 length:249 start_codon:yes stop_codon:yes gene_type:complete
MELTEEEEKKVAQKMGTPVYLGAFVGLLGTFAYLGVFKSKKGMIPKVLVGTGITMLGILAGSMVGTAAVEKYKEELEEADED